MNRMGVGALSAFLVGTVFFGPVYSPSFERVAEASPLASSTSPASVGASSDESRSAGLLASLPPEVSSGASGDLSAGGLLEASAGPALTTSTSGRCPSGMVEVEGDYCPHVEQKCLRWLDPETKLRCAEFAESSACQGKPAHKHFCIDRFEYPNKPGEKPAVMVTWYQARDACKAQGKRLCGDSEWTLACEGRDRLPYPYGHARNAEACNIDKPHPDPDEKALANPRTRAAEAARLDQRDPSGARESCLSPYGVFDMTGNVDEWVVNESGHPYQSGLKGGYWGPVRTRCRPMTTAHYEEFIFYQIGFRCCADAPSDSEMPREAPLPGEPAPNGPIPAGSMASLKGAGT